MNLVHIVLAFGAGVIATMIGFIVLNVRKPEQVDKVEGDIRAGASKVRDVADKFK